MILPDLVLGNAGAKLITSGVAMGPISFLTWAFKEARSASEGAELIIQRTDHLAQLHLRGLGIGIGHGEVTVIVENESEVRAMGAQLLGGQRGCSEAADKGDQHRQRRYVGRRNNPST